MEARLGVGLIDRTGRGHALTATGAEIIETAEHVETEITGTRRRLSGRDSAISGKLRITCTDVMANHYLARKLAGFVALHTRIDVDIICTLQHLSLSRRAADVAVRVTNLAPETLVGRRLARVAVAVYAAAGAAAGGVEGRDWIGWQDETYNRMLIAAKLADARIRHRTDDMMAIATMARAGLGLVVLPCDVGDTDPGLGRVVAEPGDAQMMDLWVLSHPDLRRAARIRAVTQYIADCITADRDLFEGRRPFAYRDLQGG